MPTAIQLPAPANWQDFELLCRDLCAADWGDNDARRHGREGQEQAGVDVYGKRQGKWIGVQCKLREQHRGGRVTPRELQEEVGRAKAFRPGLAAFVLATTAPRDTKVQAAARKLTTKALAVQVCAWEDLVELLQAHRSVLDRHYAWDRPDQAEERELRSYLQVVKDKLGVIPLAAIHEHSDRCPTLDAVYTALDVERQLLLAEEDDRLGGEEAMVPQRSRGEAGMRKRRFGSSDEENAYLRARTEFLRDTRETRSGRGRASGARRLRAVEFLAAHRHAVLLGPPGSGKSAFASFVAVCLANERLGHTERGLAHLAGIDPAGDTTALRADDVWPFGALIPLFVELRAFVNDAGAFPKATETPHAGHLIDHLQTMHAKVPIPAACVPFVRQALLGAQPGARPGIGGGRGVLLLLDGLDETPTDDATRTQLKRVILAFVAAYPHARVLVTSRSYAYRTDAAWRLPGFTDEVLAPLDPPAVERFVRAWYDSLARSGTLGTHDVGDRPRQLLDRFAADRHLRPLAERPLLLTLLHASGKMGDGGRAAVYGASVELLFDRWNEVRGGERTDHFHDLVGLDKSVMLKVLQAVARRVHGEQGRTASQAAAIPFAVLWDELAAARARTGTDRVKVDERRALDYLDERAGLLLAEGSEVFRFPHRSYQEFLAAQHFCRDDDFPADLCAALRHDVLLWREVLGFCVLIHAPSNPSAVWAMIEELVPADPDETAKDDDYRIAIALAIAMAESGRLRAGSQAAGGRAAKCIDRVKGWLVQCLEAGALTAADRVEGGDALGQLGDPRIGHRPENFLPITPGSGVALGRFLVTVQEFAEFVDAKGYENDAWWEPDEGLAQRDENQWKEPSDFARQREHPNRPVVGVSWYEAWAYCRWRSEVTKTEVRLPTVDERDAVATPDGRTWPWGSEPEPSAELANYGDNVGHASPVGCYPRGAGAQRHLDLGGNVWEWQEDERARGSKRPYAEVRGGAELSVAGDLRAGSGGVNLADVRNGFVGFRVVAPASR